MGCGTSKQQVAKTGSEARQSKEVKEVAIISEKGNALREPPAQKEKLLLNGHPLSQPCRSVQWYVDYSGKEKDVDIHFVDVIGGEHKSDGYLSKHPNGQIPTLEIDDEFFLSESSAILKYLSGDDALAPKSLKDETKLNEYIGRHLSSVRKMTTEVFFHGMFGKGDKEAKMAAGFQSVKPELERWDATLSKQDYVLGDALTLADFLFAPEIDQLQLLGLLTNFPNIVKYLKRLSTNVKGYQRCWDGAEEVVAKFKASQPTPP